MVGVQDLHLHWYGLELGSDPPTPQLTTLHREGLGTGTQTFSCGLRQVLKSCMVPGDRGGSELPSPTSGMYSGGLNSFCSNLLMGYTTN